MRETHRGGVTVWHVGAWFGFTLAVLPVLLVGGRAALARADLELPGQDSEAAGILWLASCCLTLVGGILGVWSGGKLRENGRAFPWYARAAMPLALLSPLVSIMLGFLYLASMQ